MLADSGETLRFRDVELNVAGYELRRRGRRVRLERQPMDLLILLVERRGQLVSRNDIVERLWGKDVFIDVETGIHRAILKIRQALHDSPDAPAFIETVSGKGYRFIAPIEVVSSSVEPPASAVTPAGQPSAPVGLTHLESASQPRPRGRRPVAAMTAAVGLIGLVIMAALTWAGFGGSSRTPHMRLAVLPFENLTGDPGREYQVDGLTEEMSTVLGQVLDPKHVTVIGRASMMGYKSTKKSLADIGRAEDVDYLLVGSMRADGDRVRVTSNLVRVRDQVPVWSDMYDSEPTKILDAQRELSAAIGQQVSLSLSRQRLNALERRHTRNPAAYDLYQQGVALSKLRTPDANQAAIGFYKRAIDIDADYALAWSGIALTYSASTINSGAAPRDVAQYAEDAARRAVKIAPELAEARLALGHVSWLLLWDWRAAEDEFRKAVDLDPNSAQAKYLLGHVLSQRRRHSEARRIMDRARALEFNDPMMHAMSAQVAFQAHDYNAALEHGRHATVIAKDFWIGHIQVAQVQQERGRADLALEALGKDSRDNGSLALRGYILAKQGRKREAHDVLNALAAEAKVRKDGYVPPSHMALVHAGLGDKKEVFAWLEKAFAAHDVRLIFLPVDPKWDPYRTDPWFKELLARCGFTDDE